MTTSTNNQWPRSGQSGGVRNEPVQSASVAGPVHDTQKEFQTDCSNLCQILRSVHPAGMPEWTIFQLAQFLMQGVGKDLVDLTVGPQFAHLRSEIQNTLQCMGFGCWSLLRTRHNRMNGSPDGSPFRELRLADSTAERMRANPQNLTPLFFALSLVGVRRLKLRVDEGVYNLRDACSISGLEEIVVLPPAASQRWHLLIRPGVRVTFAGLPVPEERLLFEPFVPAHSVAPRMPHTVRRGPDEPAGALLPVARCTAEMPRVVKPEVRLTVPPKRVLSQHSAAQVISPEVKVKVQPKRVPAKRPQSASADPGAAVAMAAPARSVLVPLEPLQPLELPPAPPWQPQLAHLRRSAINPSSLALLALCGTAMLAGGLRRSLDSGLQFEPAMAGPTALPPDLRPETVDPLATPDTPLGPGGMSFLERQCPMQQPAMPQPAMPQPLAVDTRPTEAGFDVHPQPVADLMAGKGFDGKPGLLVAMGSGQTAEVAAYMKRLAALELSPLLSAGILAKAADDYHALARAMLNQHITSVAAFMDGLKELHLDAQQVADIVGARGLRGSSGLHLALVEGKSAAVAEFLERLKGLGLDSQQMTEVVAARDINGYPGLFYALERGSALAVPVFMEGLQGLGLSRPQMAAVVAAKVPGISDGLYQAMGRGHAGTVTVVMEGLKALGLLPEQIVDILTARDIVGNPGLYIASVDGHAAVVTAFMNGLKGLGLSGPQILDIIKCEDAQGIGGLYMGLQQGRTPVVRALMAGLKGLGLSPELVAQAITARNPAGLNGLYVAMHQGHAQSVKVFIDSLRGLGLGPQQIADVVEPRHPDGGNALSAARHRGQAHAAKAYSDALTRLQRLGLIGTEQVDRILRH